MSLFLIAYKSPKVMKNKTAINILAFIEEYYLQEKP